MSLLQIQKFHRKLESLQRVGHTANEQSIRFAFKMLLNYYCESKNLSLIPELAYGNIRPDGTIKDNYSNDIGFWESKDLKDDFYLEIEKKIAKGYPTSNIIFENSQTVILYQKGQKVAETQTINEKEFDKLLKQFVNFELPEIKEFRKAVESFKENIPKLAEALRKVIKEQDTSNNKKYLGAKRHLIDICKQSINPNIKNAEVNEMLVQHILTEDMFLFIFSETQFHRENNIALAMNEVLKHFYTGKIKRQISEKVGKFYLALKSKVGNINDLNEKQKVLKIAYEEFYKAYNPKGADRLGVVYTPNELVKFMIESTDYLCYKHFGKGIADKGINILDPATGTGTYITSLLQYIPSYKLKQKYQKEIHCNELALLPYYIANLNIEYTYHKLMNEYEPFENIVLTDTLDNTSALKYTGKQSDFFGVSEENTERIKRQNEQKISVIIGNPPYNANQQNFNDFNANRKYPTLDKRIKDTFVKYSTAQKTKVYDMYSRFYRWAIDRLEEKGIIAFITNRSFIDSRTFDGFRKCLQDDFSNIYVIDTQSDVRRNPKISGTKHNVFGIQTGVAILFLVKKQDTNKQCKIEYFTLTDRMPKTEKLKWFKDNEIQNIPFECIIPSKKNNWLNLTDNDFETLLPLMDKKEKQVVFRTFANAIKTNRDVWVYDISKRNLEQKSKYLSDKYNKSIKVNKLDTSIKWSRDLMNELKRKKKVMFSKDKIKTSFFRPFSKRFYFSEKILNDVLTQNHCAFFGENLDKENLIINLSDTNTTKPFSTLATNSMSDYHFMSDTKCLPFYTYDQDGKRHENITDWGLSQFQTHYQNADITKLDIFHYTYAVLHNPQYRAKYELNLKRDFPRLPFYTDFSKWVCWGKALMSLHLDYEQAEPFKLKTAHKELKKPVLIKPKLKANKVKGIIELDTKTSLTGVPMQAWQYKLGNRSALEWVLDQHKEKKIRDKTIAEKFNTYRFSDYKKQVINLLKRVCTVSVETMKIIEEMRKCND